MIGLTEPVMHAPHVDATNGTALTYDLTEWRSSNTFILFNG